MYPGVPLELVVSVGTGGASVRLHIADLFLYRDSFALTFRVPLDYVCVQIVFTEIKVPPRIGWDGVVGQILDSATDAEQVHHILEVRQPEVFVC